MKPVRLLPVMALSFLIGIELASATTYYVNAACATSGNGLGSGCSGTNRAKKTISEGLAVANDDDTVKVVPGEYIGSSNRSISVEHRVTLICDGVPGSCIVDCDSDSCTLSAHWAFHFDHDHMGVGQTATLDGFKITNCNTTGGTGGAIWIAQTNPTIRNCTFTSNCAYQGGAIALVKDANARIENCVFLGNKAFTGGAIYAAFTGADNVAVTIENCIIGKDATGQRNQSTSNFNGQGGGGVFLQGPGTITMKNTRIEGNISEKEGAGIAVVGKNALFQMANCVLAKNSVVSSADDGGGIAVLGLETSEGGSESTRAWLRLMNSIVVANSGNKGGGIYVGKNDGSTGGFSQVEFVNSLLYGNTASATNGGHEMWFGPNNVVNQDFGSGVRNGIIWKIAATGKSIERIQGKLTIEESDVSDLSSLSNGITLTDNISSDPLFIDVDGADNTLGTVDDNFRIANYPTASPCKDTGDETLRLEDFADLDENDNTSEDTPLDLDLVDRVSIDDRVIGSEIDMGPYEIDVCTTNVDCGADDDPCNGLEKCDQAHCVIDIDDCNLNGIDDFCDIMNGPSEDCDANGVPDDEVCQPGEQLAVMLLAIPAHEHSLWRTQKNTIRFTFACDISTPGSDDVLIQEMLNNGDFDSDVSSGFTFTVENGNVLKVRETASSLTHRKWYAIRNTGGWNGVANFEVQYVVQMGDANDDGRVLFSDLGLINTGIPTNPAADDDRRDINGDASILFSDMGAANANVPSDTVTEPTGHEPP